MKIKKEFKINPFSTKKLKFMAALFVCFSLLAIAMVPITQKGLDATKTDDTTSYVMVDEIWNETNGTFNSNTLSSLLQYITGNEDITASDVASTKINQTRTSADIRTTAVNSKTNTQDVQVTFGGLTWQVVYLTQDRSRNDIVTLWLSNNYQEAWEGRSATEGTYYGFIDGALYSDWSNNFDNSSFTVTYPSSLYGASYIHAVTLNNGGTYATSTSAVTSQPAQQDSNSVFAMFTMDSVAGSVTKYLVTPSEVAYQETENSNTQFGNSYYYPNEAYGEPNGSGSWNTSNGGAVNITTNKYYDAWADDTLWLPSLTETGYSGTTGNLAGIWQTSTAQRASNTGSDSSMGIVGTASGTAYNYSWLRSGSFAHAYNAYTLYASGSGRSGNYVYSSYAVRPALHLNLNSAASNSYDPTVWDGTSTEAPTLQNPAQANSEDNPYIIDSAAKLAWISANYNQSNCYGQHYLQTVDIDLNNHPWTPINNVSSTSSSNRRAYYYDGGEHTISNLYINTAEQTLALNDYLGLFGLVYGSSSNHAYIKNLGIVNGSIVGEGSRYVGAVVGEASYTDITNCYNEKTDITMTGSSQSVGGVAGFNFFGTISGSYNTGTVSGSREVGGVAGNNINSGTISGSYNTGTVSGVSYVGGVVGNNNSGGTISGSYNTGIVSGDDSVGGVAGYNSGTISSSYNTGTVSGERYVGGVAGYNQLGTISGSYNTGSVSGSGQVGGVAGYNDSGTISGSYNDGDITGTSNYVGGVVGQNSEGTISSSYNTGTVSGRSSVGGVAGSVRGSSSSSAVISSCFSTGAITRTSGRNTTFGGVVGYIENSTSYPSQYVSISWCYYNTETVGSVVTKAIGQGNGYQCYGLTTAQMQGDKNQNYMYLSDTIWNFASGEYPTLKYVAQPQN